MNEIRDLIIGIDIGKEYTQICYYDRKAEEARSLSMKVGASQYEAPGCICYRTDHGDYCVGLEAEYFAREKGGRGDDGILRLVLHARLRRSRPRALVAYTACLADPRRLLRGGGASPAPPTLRRRPDR